MDSMTFRRAIACLLKSLYPSRPHNLPGPELVARPRYMAHPDKNQGQIIQDLHDSIPCLVDDVSNTASTHDIEVWAQDIRTGRWRWTKWEIKDAKDHKRAEKKLTGAQRKRMQDWPGSVLLAISADDILKEYGRL